MSPYQLFLIYGLEYITCIFNTYSVSVFSAETRIMDPFMVLSNCPKNCPKMLPR